MKQPGGFVCYRLSGNLLSAPAAFATFAVFNAMQFSVGTLSLGIKVVTEVLVALRRIKVLLASVPVGCLWSGGCSLNLREYEEVLG